MYSDGRSQAVANGQKRSSETGTLTVAGILSLSTKGKSIAINLSHPRGRTVTVAFTLRWAPAGIPRYICAEDKGSRRVNPGPLRSHLN